MLLNYVEKCVPYSNNKRFADMSLQNKVPRVLKCLSASQMSECLKCLECLECLNALSDRGRYHTEFYKITASVMKELNARHAPECLITCTKYEA